jgi:hypothetical protein
MMRFTLPVASFEIIAVRFSDSQKEFYETVDFSSACPFSLYVFD